MNADDTLPPDPLASTIPSPPPAFHIDGVPAFEVPGDRAPMLIEASCLIKSSRPAWFYSDNWDGFASETLDEE